MPPSTTASPRSPPLRMQRRGLLFGEPEGEVLAPDDGRAVLELLEG